MGQGLYDSFAEGGCREQDKNQSSERRTHHGDEFVLLTVLMMMTNVVM